MRLSRTLLSLSLALALAAVPARAAAPPRAAGPPAKPPQDALGAIHDMKLTVLARRALGPLKLDVRVEVRQGVAQLLGEVASAAEARQAVEALAAVPNLHAVRTDGLRASNGESLADLNVRVPRQEVRVAKPPAPPPVTAKTKATTVSGAGKKPFRPATSPPPPNASERSVVVGAPTVRKDANPQAAAEGAKATRSSKPLTQPSQGGLSEAVAKVKESDARFRSIPVRVSEGVVVISRRSDADEEAVAALLYALRRVSGVLEVRQVNE